MKITKNIKSAPLAHHLRPIFGLVLTYFLISQSEGAASENSETSWENAIKQAFKPVQSRSIEADAHDTESNADENTQHANC